AIDDVRIYNYALSEEEVKALYKSSYATNPHPADGAVVNPENDLKLNWTPGTGAVRHKVYFGADREQLTLLGEVEKPGYAKLQPLEKDTDYFWRIDEVQEDGSVLTGDIWSFNTGKLIAWWKLDESQGRRANDSAGDNAGILEGDPSWITGQIGSALEFDGVDDYVDVGRSTDFGIREQVTIAAWLKTNDAGNGEVNPYVITAKYGLKQKASNVLEFYIFTDTWHVVWFDVDNTFNSNWHHLAGAYDGRELKLYIDGVVEGSTFHTGIMGPDTSSIRIGGEPWPARRYYDGAIDDVRIYNYALGEDEIRALYNKGKKR
ncbi:MAG: LamG domain-containing protein, partial [Planctomycetota bacterium]